MPLRHRVVLSVLLFSLLAPASPLHAQSSSVRALLEPSSETASAMSVPSGQGTSRQPQDSSLPPPSLYLQGETNRLPPSFSSKPAWAQQAYPVDDNRFPPFGANLFQGYFAGTYAEGVNSDYSVMPGDRIQLHIWGAHAYSDVVMVDPQGNIFLPEVGPVPVGGLSPGAMRSAVHNYISRVFRDSAEIYVNLLTAQPVAVYVTGFVQRPGRYAGGGSDTVLYYLDRAGGILPDRGSYRDIAVKRDGRVIARVDLYSFVLDGTLSGGRLRDGDVIVVGPKKDSIMARGLIPQQASFESAGAPMNGADLVGLAAPLPSASHVSVVGTRQETPFHIYLPLREFAGFALGADDTVEFLADRPSETIMVSVSGSILGATRYPVTRATTLRTLLAHVPVDPALSNLSGIYLKRRSVVEQERKAIADALRRLEQSVLTAPSINQESAGIRAQEASLVQNFVQRASLLVPDGVVVVTRSGQTADVILEDGDEVIIPQKSDVVQITGEVLMAKAVVHIPGQGVKAYVESAGGLSPRADQSNILVVHPNGEIARADEGIILPGDLVMVMPKYERKGFSIFKDIVQVLYQIAVATKVVIDI